MYGLPMAHNTISLIVHQCCGATFDEYFNEFMRFLRTSNQWKAVAAELSTYLLVNRLQAYGCAWDKHEMSLEWQVTVFQIQGVPPDHSLCPLDANNKLMWVPMDQVLMCRYLKKSGQASSMELYKSL